MELHELIQRQIDFDRNHKGRKEFFTVVSDSNIEDLEHLLVCLVGEVGEFANLVKKVSRGDFTISDCKEDLTDELADILIYLLKAFAQLQIDPEKAFLAKLEQNEKRFFKYKRK